MYGSNYLIPPSPATKNPATAHAYANLYMRMQLPEL